MQVYRPEEHTGERVRSPEQPARGAMEPMQALYWRRLKRMAALARYCRGLLKDGDPELKLLQLGTYSTYCDCLALGLGEQAREMLRSSQIGAKPSQPPVAEGNR